MGLVLSAANVRGWTTDSGMEGPPVPAGSESESSTEKISTFPCSLFTKSPRRRMRVAFTCNVCGQGTTRAINPHVYTEVPAGSESESSTEKISTFPWSLFTKSPRRRMRVSFTCNVCGQRTTRAINPHAYTDGTVFVQCCGCNVFHKLVDNLNLFHEMKCYVNPSFNYRDPKGDVSFTYLDMDDDNNDIFPLI